MCNNKVNDEGQLEETSDMVKINPENITKSIRVTNEHDTLTLFKNKEHKKRRRQERS